MISHLNSQLQSQLLNSMAIIELEIPIPVLRENKEGKKWIDLFFLVKIGSQGTWKSLSNKANFVA